MPTHNFGSNGHHRTPEHSDTCQQTEHFGIRVVGKGSWKEREVGKF